MENEEVKTNDEVVEETTATQDSGTKAFVFVVAASMAAGAIVYNGVIKPVAKKLKEKIAARKGQEGPHLVETDGVDEDEEPEE